MTLSGTLYDGKKNTYTGDGSSLIHLLLLLYNMHIIINRLYSNLVAEDF